MVGFEALQVLNVKCLEQQIAMLSTINFPSITCRVRFYREEPEAYPAANWFPIGWQERGQSAALASWGCHNKVPQTVWLRDRTVWCHPPGRSPQSRWLSVGLVPLEHREGGSVPGLSPRLADGRLLFLSLHHPPSVCLRLIFSIRAQSQGLGPTLLHYDLL